MGTRAVGIAATIRAMPNFRLILSREVRIFQASQVGEMPRSRDAVLSAPPVQEILDGLAASCYITAGEV